MLPIAVIASAAKQSPSDCAPPEGDCFVAPLLAMTTQLEPTTADLDTRRAARRYPERPIVAVLAVGVRPAGLGAL